MNEYERLKQEYLEACDRFVDFDFDKKVDLLGREVFETLSKLSKILSPDEGKVVGGSVLDSMVYIEKHGAEQCIQLSDLVPEEYLEEANDIVAYYLGNSHCWALDEKELLHKLGWAADALINVYLHEQWVCECDTKAKASSDRKEQSDRYTLAQEALEYTPEY